MVGIYNTVPPEDTLAVGKRNCAHREMPKRTGRPRCHPNVRYATPTMATAFDDTGRR